MLRVLAERNVAIILFTDNTFMPLPVVFLHKIKHNLLYVFCKFCCYECNRVYHIVTVVYFHGKTVVLHIEPF